MKTYKAIVKNKETGERTIIKSDYNSKKDFLKDLRSNGYAVSDCKVKEEKLFDYILETTNCSPEDWKNTKLSV